jgi:hypothetical protein
MTYPELDTAVVEAAREKRAKLYASAEQTKINIKNLEAALQTCNEEHARQIALAAAGEDVPAEAAADLANATRRHEESLRRQREILALQNSNILAAEKEFGPHPGKPTAPALSSQFGSFTTPARPQPPRQDSIWLGYQIPTTTDDATLRATWGELAAEALSETAAAS